MFQRGGGGHTVSNRGYAPDCHVDFHAVFYYCDKKRLTKRKGGGVTSTLDPLAMPLLCVSQSLQFHFNASCIATIVEFCHKHPRHCHLQLELGSWFLHLFFLVTPCEFHTNFISNWTTCYTIWLWSWSWWMDSFKTLTLLWNSEYHNT